MAFLCRHTDGIYTNINQLSDNNFRKKKTNSQTNENFIYFIYFIYFLFWLCDTRAVLLLTDIEEFNF